MTLRGIVRGNAIEFAGVGDLKDGEEVEVEIVRHNSSQPRVWGEGIRRSAGALADMPELDLIMDQIQADRKADLGQPPLEPRD